MAHPFIIAGRAELVAFLRASSDSTTPLGLVRCACYSRPCAASARTSDTRSADREWRSDQSRTSCLARFQPGRLSAELQPANLFSPACSFPARRCRRDIFRLQPQGLLRQIEFAASPPCARGPGALQAHFPSHPSSPPPYSMQNHRAAADWWPASRLPAADLLGAGLPAELASNPPCPALCLPVEPAPAESPSDRSTGRTVLDPVAELYYRCSPHLPKPAVKPSPPLAGNSHLERCRQAADY